MDISSIDELLTTTRAVRKRLDLTRPVGRDVILECVQLAMQAPTASNEPLLSMPLPQATTAPLVRSARLSLSPAEMAFTPLRPLRC